MSLGLSVTSHKKNAICRVTPRWRHSYRPDQFLGNGRQTSRQHTHSVPHTRLAELRAHWSLRHAGQRPSVTSHRASPRVRVEPGSALTQRFPGRGIGVIGHDPRELQHTAGIFGITTSRRARYIPFFDITVVWVTSFCPLLSSCLFCPPGEDRQRAGILSTMVTA